MPHITPKTPAVLGAFEAINDCDSHEELFQIIEAAKHRIASLNTSSGPNPFKPPVPFTPPKPTARGASPRDFRIGERVEFTLERGRDAGTVVRGKVRRINRKTVTVYPDIDPSKGYVQRVGYYRVPPRMLRKI